MKRLSLAVLLAVLGVLGSSGGALASQGASQGSDRIWFNSVYTQNLRLGSMGTGLSFGQVISDNVWELPLIGGALASVDDGDCRVLRRHLLELSSEEIVFSAGYCHDARRLSFDTVFGGGSNWGFLVSARAVNPLNKGPNELKTRLLVVKGRDSRRAFEACSRIFSRLSRMGVSSRELVEKRDAFGNVFSNEIQIKGGCMIVSETEAQLTVTPVIIGN